MSNTTANPFTPIFGKVPAVMAGREQIALDIQFALKSEGNDPYLISLFVGPQGMGKTAMLSACADMAEADGWIVARVTATPGLLAETIARLKRSGGHLLGRAPDKKLSAVSIAPIGSIEWDRAPIRETSWRSKMEDILDQLATSNTGVLVTVNEVDPDLPEMTTLVTTFQHFFDEGRKVALLMAGLPYKVSGLLSGKSTSFLRRAARVNFGPVSDAEIDEALRLTVHEVGKDIADDALALCVEAIGGFPYMLQLVGYRAWSIAGTNRVINANDAAAAIEIAQRELEERVFEATLFDLTNADMTFLQAMLQDEGATPQAEMAKRLGKQSGHVSKYKKRLLQQGIIRERARGRLEFCLPGFKEYLLRETI